MTDDREITDLLRNALRPYIARLSDPEVVAATDARAAASIVKMLLETCDGGTDALSASGDALCRRDMLDALREIVREQNETEKDEDAPTAEGRKNCPEADG